MIIVRLRGGLGNQMFQYAFGRALSAKNGSPLALDISHYAHTGPRAFELGDLGIGPDRIIRSSFASKLRRFAGRYRALKNLFFYDPAAAASSGDLYLDGYWESYKYFAGAEALIRQEFALKEPSEAFARIAASIPKGSLSVHVRRGDFLTSAASSKVLNGTEYVERAARTAIERRGEKPSSITIFSDDKEWCRKELQTVASIPAHVFDEPVSAAEELALMSLHTDNVISNSTYSWWAAYLNPAADKIVVAPRGWLVDPAMNERYVSDIVPPGWLIA